MPTKPERPDINYLAKDYASFRRLILDHMAGQVPQWSQQNNADLGMVLVEIAAYAADYLSYYQDAVATEAYLGTARQRRSIRRHLRLLDYALHDGCNARTWVHFQVDKSDDAVVIQSGTQLLTKVDLAGVGSQIIAGSLTHTDAMQQNPIIFEVVDDAVLHPENNMLSFFVEGGQPFTLPQGATSATLRTQGSADAPLLTAGDILIFEEMRNPVSGSRAEVDVSHRHAIQLTRVQSSNRSEVSILEIEWGIEDALPFDLKIADYFAGVYVPDITIVLGNNVLADHGRTIVGEQFAPFPASLMIRFRPAISQPGLTQHQPYDAAQSASDALYQNTWEALPHMTLMEGSRSLKFAQPVADDLFNDSTGVLAPSEQDVHSIQDMFERFGIVLTEMIRLLPSPHGMLLIDDMGHHRQQLVVRENGTNYRIFSSGAWSASHELLGTDPFMTRYVVELENDGTSYLRFGFEQMSKYPDPGTRFAANYRVGNGTQGNIGADALAHIVNGHPAISTVRNPLPAVGGTDPESSESARLSAPRALREQLSCVQPSDYAEIALRHPNVSRALAQVRYLVHQPIVFLYLQRRDGRVLDDAFKAAFLDYFESYRPIGVEIDLRDPVYIDLDIKLTVLTKATYSPNSVRRAVESAMSASMLPNGDEGFFHADHFDFGTPVYQSQLVACVMDIPGVERVYVERFAQLGDTSGAAPDELMLGALEIARLDAPLHGRLEIDVEPSS